MLGLGGLGSEVQTDPWRKPGFDLPVPYFPNNLADFRTPPES